MTELEKTASKFFALSEEEALLHILDGRRKINTVIPSYDMYIDCLPLFYGLKRRGFIEISQDHERVEIEITEKGNEALENIKKLRGLNQPPETTED